MNYKLHYDLLIEKARNRSILKTEYKEIHHILPRCLGGTDDQENLISLFPEEHLIAHLLLVKIYPNNKKLIYAANMMTSFYSTSNKKYLWLKKQHSELMRQCNPMQNEAIRKKVGNSLKGKPAWNKGLDATDERVKKNIYERSAECREKSRQGRLGKKLSEASKQLLRDQMTGRPNFKNAKEVILISPDGTELLVRHRIAEKCRELGISYKALNKYRNEFVPVSTRKNSFLREATVGWCLKDSHIPR